MVSQRLHVPAVSPLEARPLSWACMLAVVSGLAIVSYSGMCFSLASVLSGGDAFPDVVIVLFKLLSSYSLL